MSSSPELQHPRTHHHNAEGVRRLILGHRYPPITAVDPSNPAHDSGHSRPRWSGAPVIPPGLSGSSGAAVFVSALGPVVPATALGRGPWLLLQIREAAREPDKFMVTLGDLTALRSGV